MHKFKKKTQHKNLVLVVIIVGTEVSVVGKAIGASWRRMCECVLAYRNIILEIFSTYI